MEKINCTKVMEQNRVTEDLEEKVQEIAKTTINFLLKNKIPLTPINYDEWFYVICKAYEDEHVMSEKNLKVLYKKYIEDFHHEIKSKQVEIKKLSDNLHHVAQGSKNALETFHKNVIEHNLILNESSKAIDEQDLQKIEQLQVKIKKLEEENKKLKEYLEKTREKIKFIEEKLATTRYEADIDSLTKIFNRKRFDIDTKKFDLEGVPYSIIFLDIDDFKYINDTYGHVVGDKVLQEIGYILHSYLRRNTYAYRYGGEEFVIILPFSDKETAKLVADRLREVIENRSIKIDDEKVINITASLGVAQKYENEKIEDVLKRADEALYEAKRNGKNQVVVK